MEVLAFDLTSSLDTVQNVLIVALGLGLVIFFHELGHFAVAKWCDVNVERFSIGFGPILWRWKRGETEYALSAIPFGGYVKMVGQDDADPGQMSNEDLAQDPRSYPAKSVPQRMAIISAGVAMNVITGTIFFLIAFRSGIEVPESSVGGLQVGMPAWVAGMQTGDLITAMNGRVTADFNDVLRGTALSRGDIDVEGVHANGEKFRYRITPDTSGTKRMIGIAPGRSPEVVDYPPGFDGLVALPGTPAGDLEQGFRPGDIIRAAGAQPVKNYADLQQALAKFRDQPLDFQVARRPEGATDDAAERPLVTVHVPPAHFRTLGLRMDIGRITAVQDGSPAAERALRVGDRIVGIDGRDVGQDLDPLRLPDYFGERHGHDVVITIQREVAGGPPEKREITIVPRDRTGWTEPPAFEKGPLSIPAIGIAYQLTPAVQSVDPDGPAARSGIQPKDTITRVEFLQREGARPDADTKSPYVVEVGSDNWAFAFWLLQETFATRTVRLTVKSVDAETPRTVEITPAEVPDWYLPTTRGLELMPAARERKANSILEAFGMGWHQTTSSMMDVYLTLRSLTVGELSVKELQGPLGIAKTAYRFAQTGLAQFLVFLGLLSINLAVLNFLPIPVLDGGHMVFLLWEGISRRRPNERIVVAATYAGLAFVLGLMVLVIYLDLFVAKR